MHRVVYVLLLFSLSSFFLFWFILVVFMDHCGLIDKL